MHRFLRWYRGLLNAHVIPGFIRHMVERVGLRWYRSVFRTGGIPVQSYRICPVPGVCFVAMLDWKDYADASMLFFQAYEEQNTKFLLNTLRPGDTFVDVGANVGYFSLLVAARYPDARVIAVEPLRRNGYTFEQSIAANHFQNIALEKVAVGAHEGEAILKYRTISSSSPSTVGFFGTNGIAAEAYMSEERVRLTTMASIFLNHHITHCRCIKMDIQGAELDALKGAHEILVNKVVDYFIIEHTLMPNRGEDVRELLAGYGYMPHALLTDGNLRPVEKEESLRQKRDYVYYV